MSQETFDRKVAELEGIFSFTIEYVPHSVGRKDDWIHGHFGLQRKDGEYFKVLFVRASKKAADVVTGTWTQPVVVQQHNQYDSFACDRVIGDIVLPVRIGENDDGSPVMEFGITAVKGPGSNGSVTFSAPRASLSNPEELPLKVLKEKLKQLKPDEESDGENENRWLYRRLVRPDVNRMTGRVRIWVVIGNETQWKNCVWFTAVDIQQLLRHEKMTDSPTRELMYYVLGNSERIASLMALTI